MRTTADIRDNLDFVGCDNATAMELCDEVDRLQAIVDRLPKTADGVPIVADMEVWLIGSNCDPFQVTVENEIVIRFPDQETSRHYTSWCYSTKEAAEKARAT